MEEASEAMKKETRAVKKKSGPTPATKRSRSPAPSRAVDTRPTGQPKAPDWRSETLARIRTLILQADPELVEEVKWRKPSNSMAGVPVWSRPSGGMICTGETYKQVVKVTFARGAALPDPSGLFNASLEGGTRRAIDLHQGDAMDEAAFMALIRAAAALAASPPGRKTGKGARRPAAHAASRTGSARPVRPRGA